MKCLPHPCRAAAPCRSAFLPTHVERTPELAADGLRWLREGGCVDLTAGKPVTLLRDYN